MERSTSRLVKKLQYIYQQMGIKNKAFLLVSALIIISLAIFITLFLTFFNRKVSQDNIANSHRVLSNITSQLDTYFDEISAIANEANYNYYLQNYLIQERGKDAYSGSIISTKMMQNYEMSSKLFNYALNNRSDVSSVIIFNENNMVLHRSIYTYISVITDYKNFNWYREAIDHEGSPVITGPQQHEFLSGNTEKTLTLSRTISSYEDGSLLGVILIDFNLNEIANIFDSSWRDTEGSLCIINDAGQIIYEEKRHSSHQYVLETDETLARLLSQMDLYSQGDFIAMIDGGKYQIVYTSMETTGWTIVSVVPRSYITQSLYAMIAVIIAVVGIFFIIIIVVLNNILTRIIKPLIDLKNHMDIADANNLAAYVEVDSQDETGMLAKSFNRMLMRIEALMSQVVQEQEEKRKFELQALQAQINPHFLYNTLDSIIWMAELNDPNVVPMTEALARLFRISLNKGNEFISIEKELEHVQNYLVIQSMRYINKFNYEITMDEAVRRLYTVKLIVQPIVENSIYHGMKNCKKKGMISIHAGLSNETVIITVKDDGSGMSEEYCRAILEKDFIFENSSGSGIGVKNVNERIKLYFGQDYGLSFESQPDVGTVATIRIPSILYSSLEGGGHI